MDTTDLRKKNDKDLAAALAEAYDALRAFRFGASGAKAKDVKHGKNLRKDIARIKTILRERALGAGETS
jgi:ribosomal protein L29